MGPLHDGTDRSLFSRPEMVEDLLRGFFAEPWVDEIDFGSLMWLSERHRTEATGGAAQEVVWRVQWRRQDLYLYVLIACRSIVERAVASYVVDGLVLLYRDLPRRVDRPAEECLPPVLPIVVSKSSHPDAAPIELIDLIEPTTPGLELYLPRLRYVRIEVARVLLRQLEHRFGTVSPSTRARIDRADTETLVSWGERILTARGLEAVFEVP